MRLRWTITPVLFFALAASSGEDDKGAEESFAKLQEEITRLRKLDGRDPRADGRDLFVRDVQRVRLDRDELFAELEKARVTKVKEAGERALVKFSTGDDTRAVLLERVRGKWLLGCARSFVLASDGLTRSRGKKPATARLAMRTNNGPYGASAYSFTHASGDMLKYKNRADIWFCHNQDFHVRGGIVDLGKTSIKSVKSIPLDARWARTARVEAGHTYVLRCGPDKRRDFFVVCRVRRMKRNAAELEWTLLTGGFNAPVSIHKPRRLTADEQRDAADGTDGLCGRNR